MGGAQLHFDLPHERGTAHPAATREKDAMTAPEHLDELALLISATDERELRRRRGCKAGERTVYCANGRGGLADDDGPGGRRLTAHVTSYF